MTRRILLLMLAVVALAVAGSACGGGDDEEAQEPAATTEDTGGGGGGGGETIELAADPGGALAFDQTELTASAGEVTIHLTNDAQIPHNVEVEGNGVEEVSDTITASDTNLTLTLEPGEYEFYCAVPGHREGGMEGTLTVE
jgi:plastocyanin